MKARRLLLTAVLFVSVASFAQQNCAYTFTWTKPSSFSFCVTSYGTIGMIQSPVGTNHLDAKTPVEGFGWVINDSSGGQSSGAQIPGLGDKTGGIATFSQPNGSGTLPLIATMFGGSFQETITANPGQRTITIKFKVIDCGFDCEWEGYISRVANTALDGTSVNNFGSTQASGLAFLQHGLMLTGPCGGIDQNGASSSVYTTCGGQPFTGKGAIFADGFFSTLRTHHSVLTFTYRVFD